MTDIADWCKAHDILLGYGRGSVNGSVIAWLLGITEMDAVKYNLNFERFMSKERVSLSDIDSDLPPSRREEVKDYLFAKDGLHCCDIITFNTIALRGAIRDVARALEIPLDKVDEICDLAEKDIETAKEQYPELFEYVDIVNGTIVSIGTHPCGCVTSPFTIDDGFGLCTTATSSRPVSQIYMKEIDSLNYVKLDLLALDTIELINNTCSLIGIDRFTPDNIRFDDDKVWDSIRDDTTLIFQWESDSAQAYIKQLFSEETIRRWLRMVQRLTR
jgi:DNA polymerase-3 subunit alpha